MSQAGQRRAARAATTLLLGAAAMSLLALALGSGRELAVAAGWPLAAGTLLNLSPRKLAALAGLGAVLGLAAAVAGWRALAAWPPAPRLAAATAATLALALPPWLLAGHVNPALDRLAQRHAFVQTAWPLWPAWSDPASPQRRPADWASLSRLARQWLDEHAHELEMPPGTDAATRRALATMHLVAQLWGTGNAVNTGREGCVRSNESNGWTVPAQTTLDTYMRARIGCCDDFAHMLHWLLREQGYESRLLTASGHILVEVRLNQAWRMIDAFTAVYVDAPFDQVNRGGRARVLLARHASEWPGSDLYRPAFATDRWRLLATLLNGGFETRRHDTLPAPFPAPSAPR